MTPRDTRRAYRRFASVHVNACEQVALPSVGPITWTAHSPDEPVMLLPESALAHVVGEGKERPVYRDLGNVCPHRVQLRWGELRGVNHCCHHVVRVGEGQVTVRIGVGEG